MSLPDTMKAAALEDFGGPDAFSFQAVPVPDLDPDRVLLRVHTAGVGVWDPHERQGNMTGMMEHEPSFPYVPGSDGSGTVVAVGDDVTRFAEGDEVWATGFLNPKGGFYAEYAAPRAEHTAPLPDGLTLREAGALPIDAVTALRGLRDTLGVREGESLLIFGASGGVGHLAVQLACRMGARTLAVASGDDGVALCEELGADRAVDGHADDVLGAARDFAPGGLDAVLATAHGEGLDQLLSYVGAGGRVAWPNGVQPEPSLPDGAQGGSYDGRPDREILDAVNDLVAQGTFRVHVDETFPLSEASRAHRRLDDHFLGKLALDARAAGNGQEGS